MENNNFATYNNGILTINEGVERVVSGEISGYKGLHTVVFPSTLKEIESEAVISQEDIANLDFSKVGQLRHIPEYMVSYGGDAVEKFIIPSGVETVGSGFLCSASLRELYVPESVKELGFPIDPSCELDAKIYIYGFDTKIEFCKASTFRLRLFVRKEYIANYIKQINESGWKNWEETVMIRPLPSDKKRVYGELPEIPILDDVPEAEVQEIEKQFDTLVEKWDGECIPAYISALKALKEEETVFANSLGRVERKWWQYPFYKKTSEKKNRHRVTFETQYNEYLINEFNEKRKTADEYRKEVEKILKGETRRCSFAVRYVNQAMLKIEELHKEAVDKIGSMKYELKEMRDDRPKLIARPEFSPVRTLRSLCFVFVVVAALFLVAILFNLKELDWIGLLSKYLTEIIVLAWIIFLGATTLIYVREDKKE